MVNQEVDDIDAGSAEESSLVIRTADSLGKNAIFPNTVVIGQLAGAKALSFYWSCRHG